MSTSLQHIIEGISEKKRSESDIRIRNLDNKITTDLFMKKDLFDELYKLVQDKIKFELEKPLTITTEYLFCKVLYFLYFNKDVTYNDLLEMLNNLDAEKIYVAAKVYNLVINKDKLEELFR